MPDGLLRVESAHLDAPPVTAGLSGDYHIRERRADLTGRAEHADLRALMPRLKSALPQPLTLDIAAKGPIEALVTDAKAHLAGNPAWAHQFTLKLTRPFGMRGDFKATPPPEIAPSAWAPLLEGGAEGNVSATYGPPGTLALERLDLRGLGAVLSASGTAALAGSTVDITATIAAGDLSRYTALAGMPLGGKARLDARVHGDQTGLQADLRLDGEKVTAAEARIAQADVTATLDTAEGWAQGNPRDLVLAAKGTVAGAAYPGAPTQEIVLQADAHAPDLEAFTLDALRVAGPGLVLEAAGQANAATRAGAATFSLAASSLEEALGPFGLDVRGSISLDGEVGFDGMAPSASAKVSGSGKDLAGLPMGAGDMLGNRFDLVLDASYASDALKVQEFTLDAPNVSASTQGTYALAAGETAFAGTAHVKRLAPFGAFARMPLAGAVEAEFTVAGPKDALTLEAHAVGLGLRVGTTELDSARIDSTMTGLPATPAGHAVIALASDGRQLDAETQFAFEQPRWHVEALTLRAGENRVDGEGVFNMETRAGQGTMEAAMPDLAYLGAVLGLELTGEIMATAAFDTGGASPHIAASVNAAHVVSPWAAVEALDLDLHARDLLAAASVELTLDGAGVTVQDNRIETAHLTASGPLDALDIAGTWDGMVLTDTPFTGTLDATAGIPEQALNLRTLQGQLGEYPFELRAPARMAMARGGFTTEPLDLRFAEGGLRASGGYDTREVGLIATLDAFPLAVANLAGGPLLEGTLSGDVSLLGTPGEPLAEATFEIADFAFVEGPQETPPLTARITARVAGGQAQAQATMAVPEAGEARAAVYVPLEFSLAPVAFAVEPDAPLTGSLDANFDLEPLARAYAAPDHEAAGQFLAAMRLDGTLSNPRVLGNMTVESGRYESALSGTILEELHVAINAQGGRIVLQELRATDGSEGRLSGQGHLELRDDFPFELDFTFDNARVVHRDDVSSRLSGPLRVAGNRHAMEVTGDLVVGPALIGMPRRSGPPTLPQAVVTEINGPNDGGAEPKAASSVMPVIHLALTVDVPRRVYVRAPVLDSEWMGKLAIRGTAQEPRIEGLLRVYKGTLDFIGREFDLTDSTLSFDGSDDIMPYVTVTGRAETRTITGILRVTGKPDALQFTLDSEPAVPKDEVLARLLFGRSVTEITPAQAVQLARVAMLLNQGMGGETLLSGGKGLGVVDSFSVGAGDDPGEAVVGVGTYITDGIYAEIQTGTGGNTSSRVLFEFSPNFSAEAETSTTGQQGVGVFWKKDY
jgi:translocation and assembly module TamB